jgi:putative nucleotidyltransferase with HDIG domain
MRGLVSTETSQAGRGERSPEKARLLVIEDKRGQRTSLPRFLSRSEYEYLFALQGNENFLGLSHNGTGAVPWIAGQTNAQKIFLAKEAMKDLGLWYEHIFRDRDDLEEEDYVERQVFFNSNLIYFIAATDDNEDTVGHSQFVASYTLLLSRELGIENKKFLADIERGALLHDIGKIGIPESILRKKGPLTLIEREIIKDHPLLGFKLIEEFSFLKRAAQVVLYHHEHYDGMGYPYGLAGEQIPLEARLFSLADTVDAITSDRPYRRGRNFEEARREIERYSGSQFDPSLVEVFLSIPEARWRRTKIETLRTLRLPTVH